MISLCKYLINLTEIDPAAKIILFLQYKELADFISDVFTKRFQLTHVRVTGNINER